MQEPSAERVQAPKAPASAPAFAAAAPARVRSSSFKYYIHDSTDTFRFKLIGEFTQADVTELNGCWRTARTTLGGRKLVIDLSSLIGADEAGKQWLESMAAEGACYVPEGHVIATAGQHAASPEAPALKRGGVLARLAALFGAKIPSTESPIQGP